MVATAVSRVVSARVFSDSMAAPARRTSIAGAGVLALLNFYFLGR
jgi:hypothetical protein